MKSKYKRIMLKLSGEALQGKKHSGIDSSALTSIAKEIKEVYNLGVELAIVIGAGNIFRGVERKAIDHSTADYMGMLATVINSLALQSSLEGLGIDTRVQSAIEMRELAESYIRRRAIRHLQKKRIVIFAGGTGNPYFTTDTAASLRAIEINADIILKATKVDGIYSADPLKVSHARRYRKISYIKVLKEGLKVMDSTAISLCMDNHLPIVVFNLLKKGNIKKVVCGEKIGTEVN